MDLPYYQESKRVYKRRDADTRKKYNNEKMSKKILDENLEEMYKNRLYPYNPTKLMITKNKNRNDLKEEAEDRLADWKTDVMRGNRATAPTPSKADPVPARTGTKTSNREGSTRRVLEEAFTKRKKTNIR